MCTRPRLKLPLSKTRKDGTPMFRFKGFSPRANDAINLALSQACLLGHTYIGQRAPAARAAAGGRRAKRRPHPKGRHPRPGAGPADQDGGARHPVPPFPHRYDPALPAHPGAEPAGEQEGFRQADRARAHPAGDAAGKGVLRPAVSDGAWGGAALILSGIQRHGAGLFAGGNSRAGCRAQKYTAPDSAGKVWPGPDRKGPLPPSSTR